MIYKTLHRKQNIEKHESQQKPGLTQVLRKGKQFQLNIWHPSCYSGYKPGGTSWMRNCHVCVCLIILLSLMRSGATFLPMNCCYYSFNHVGLIQIGHHHYLVERYDIVLEYWLFGVKQQILTLSFIDKYHDVKHKV